MRHLDLFSGIGGFALAAQRVWGKDHEVVAFCDIDPFCQAVLKKNFKGVYVHGDIRTLSVERLIANANGNGLSGKDEVNPTPTGKQAQHRAARCCRTFANAHDRRPPVGEKQTAGDKQCHIDLLTGGFPCQPFSHAGKRRGKGDDRFLWPEMLRVIKEFQPTWIIGENVAGLASMAQPEGEIDMEDESDTGESNDDQLRADGILWGIISDIENLGYEVQPLIIPACAVNAPHRRDRIWIIAYSASNRSGEGKATTVKERLQTGSQTTGKLARRPQRPPGNAPNPGHERLQGSKQRNALGKGPRPPRPTTKRSSNGWGEPWPEVATRLCVVDDGFSRRLVRLPDGRKISRSKWRQEALKAAGNAIVPAVAEVIM